MKTRFAALDMTAGAPHRLIVSFALPIMLGNLFQQVYSTTDSIILGRHLGAWALAAIGATDWLNWMMSAMINGITQGICVFLAQAKGGGDQRALRLGAAMSVWIVIVLAVLFSLLGQLMLFPALNLLETPAEVLSGSRLYLRIVFAGTPVLFAFQAVSAFLRALGDSRTPLFAMITGMLLNLLLALFFVRRLNLGIAGAASATVIAQCGLFLSCLPAVKRQSALFPRRGEWKPIKPILLRIFALGAPTALQFAIIAIGGLMMQYVMNQYGYLFIAGYTASNKLYGLVEIAAISFATAMVTYMAQNMGARKYSRIRKGLRCGLLIGMGTALATAGLILVFKYRMVGWFIPAGTPDTAQITDIAIVFLLYIGIPLPLLYFHHICRASLQGIGDLSIPLLSGIAQLVMRLAAAFLLPRLLGPYGIFGAEAAAWIGSICVLIPVCRFRMQKLPAQDGFD